MSNCVFDEYKRLKTLFSNVDESKSELSDELIKKAAFLKIELDGLEVKIKKYGAVQTSNKGNVRESIHYKTYLQTINVYQGIIRTLNTIMGKNIVDEDDEFDAFMGNLNG